ncbi:MULTISPECIES: bifunctional hydroxymethylpyrimidine kinase/phosphomethylpyrimidine kinase [Pontibacillus]|uniref:pyridoxal kinase n=1 Tax=Pontibacillus chungwhensis TaxID=265426 RepID=A0ABY8V371_9BACI|nr:MULTISPECIES: bifunctional hydroxymethylpyrimidine kinase/phosphomethylpyrimidine kinase [Pontibacillus]MCD5325773.1 bifunctional hydroxymethylpyrimidine kinase/phosphomethylpyrimidine kinase [Pontibacillus sp. HN14]WIF98306.1 bifunctional hydroxymethylpyrimidine kinase/phosphomethylpyrimidine kinase [Pontibacillus chungwhensis]
MRKKVLTIAGSDSSGGAGIQADLKTFHQHGVYGISSLTTIVAMDPENDWAHNVFPMELSTVKEQLKTAMSLGIDAVKTGMLGSPGIIEHAGEVIKQNGIKDVVIDPVMVCKGTDDVLHPENLESLRESLVPHAKVTTPNLFEAAKLAGIRRIETVEQLEDVAKTIHELGAQNVLIKAGTLVDETKATDLLYDGQAFHYIQTEQFDTGNVHGAGCSYAAAITAELANGKDVIEAIKSAKAFITAAVKEGFPLNEYVGPVYQKGDANEIEVSVTTK